MLVTDYERTFSAHHMLLHIARLELQEAGPGSTGSFNHGFLSMMCSALAMEALGNAIWPTVIPSPMWGRFEKLDPYTKLRRIGRHLGVQFEGELQSSWEALLWLKTFRDEIAHAKPVTLNVSVRRTPEQHEDSLFWTPLAPFQEKVTADSAHRSLEAVNAIKFALARAMGDAGGTIAVEIGSHSTRLE